MRKVKIYNWIDNQPVAAANDEWIDNINPCNGNVISQIPRSKAKDGFAAVESALGCYSLGGGGNSGAAGLSPNDRTDLLLAVANRMESRLEELAMAESKDTGKPFKISVGGDVPRAIDNMRFFAKLLAGETTQSSASLNSLNYVLRRPLGVVALITPWNFPIHLLTWKLAPAIAMGNSVVAKPSELTPTSAFILAQIFKEVGAAPGLFNLVHGYGSEIGDTLVRHPNIEGVSFTGGTETGKAIALAAAPLLKKTSFELGGKNPSVVFADCEFEKTLDTVARAAFFNSGQVCLCGSRILIDSKIYNKFAEGLVEKALFYKKEVGPLISQSHREKVMSYVHSARQEGNILCGGEIYGDSQGAYLEPTIIDGVHHDSSIVQEEIFGPVVTLHPFDTEAEALELANETAYGLSASIFTTNLKRAHYFSEHVQSGMVWVNDWNLRDLRVPFGGMKQSGFGREGGKYSLRFFSQDRNVCIRFNYD